MKRLIILLMTAVFAGMFAGAMSSPASAGVLPEFSAAPEFTGTAGATKLNLTGASISCTSGTESGVGSSTKVGTFELLLAGCRLGGKQCKTKGAAKEQIKAAGGYALVRIKSGVAALLFEPTVTKIECEFAAAKEVTIEGKVLAGITPLLMLTEEYSDPVTVVSEKQGIEAYENDEPAKVTAKLVGKIGIGENKAATLEVVSNRLRVHIHLKIGPVEIDLTT